MGKDGGKRVPFPGCNWQLDSRKRASRRTSVLAGMDAAVHILLCTFSCVSCLRGADLLESAQ